MADAQSRPSLPLDAILQGLNPQQRQAVEYCDGPTLVIAGPGTGKTRVITAKVLYLIAQHNYQPDQILALTFGRKANAEMLERIHMYLSHARIPSRPVVRTFHSFCFELFRQHAESLGYRNPVRLLTGAYYVLFLSQILGSLSLPRTDLVERTIHVCQYLAEFLSRCHDELLIENRDLRPAAIAWLNSLKPSEQREAEYVLDLVEAIPQILEIQRRANVVSFGDLLTQALRLVRDRPHVLEELQNQFRYVLVDELQDNNLAQFELVNALAGAHRRILVVGDEDQCIYRFRGAGFNLVLRFEEHWKGLADSRSTDQLSISRAAKPMPDFRRVTLEENYRSTEAIIDAAQTLIANNRERAPGKRIRKASSSTVTGPDKVHLRIFPTHEHELCWLVSRLREELQPQEGTPRRKPGDVAILCRSLRHVVHIVDALRQAGLEVEVVGEAGLFQNAVVQEILAWLAVLDNPLEAEDRLVRVLRFRGFGLSYADLGALQQAAQDKPLAVLLDELQAFPECTIPGVSPQGLFKLRRLGELLVRLQKETEAQITRDLGQLIEEIVIRTGLHTLLDTSTLRGRLNRLALKGFLELCQGFAEQFPEGTLADCLKFLEIVRVMDEDSIPAEPSSDENTIKVMTVHQAKGKEFPVVIVPGLGHRFPPRNRRTWHRKFLDHLTLQGKDPQEAHLEDERRVLYVALSRAKEELILTTYLEFDTQQIEHPSLFIEELLASPSVVCVEEASLGSSMNLPIAAASEREQELLERFGLLVSAVGRGLYKGNPRDFLRELVRLASAVLDEEDLASEEFKEFLQSLGLGGELLEQENAIPIEREDARQSQQLQVSPTGLAIYTRCPRQYWYRYVLKLREAERYPASFGNAVHKALEQLHREVAILTQGCSSRLMELFQEQLKTVRFRSQQEREQAFLRGSQILERLLREEEERAAEILVTEVEVPLQLPLPDGVLLTMRLDRLDALRDGRKRVVDYKTGQLDSRPGYLRDFQMPSYALGVVHSLQAPLKEVEVIGLKKLKPTAAGEVIERIRLDWKEEGSERELSRIRLTLLTEQIAEVADRIRSNDFDPTPSPEACRRCAYRSDCDACAVQD